VISLDNFFITSLDSSFQQLKAGYEISFLLFYLFFIISACFQPHTTGQLICPVKTGFPGLVGCKFCIFGFHWSLDSHPARIYKGALTL
jgi:hypothetical protein